MVVATMTLAYPVALLVFGPMDALPDNTLELLLGQIASAVAMHAIFFAVANSIGKTAIAILINIIAPTVVAILIGIIDGVLDLTKIQLSSFWIGSLLDNFSTTYASDTTRLISFFACAAYVAAALVVGSLIAKKKEY